MIQEKIKKLIQDALLNLKIEATQISLEHPSDLKMGDYSTSVAMVYAKELKINPKKLAEDIVVEINKNLISELSKVEAVNGFINFYLSPSYYFNRTKDILKLGENYGHLDIHKGRKILVEHSSPNLFKPFHIGHVMNNAIGESINRLAHFSGAEVEAISYPSDVSLGIGKAVWALMQDGVEKLNNLESEAEKLSYLGSCYVRGTKALEDDPSLEPRIREITKIIYESIPSPEYEAYKIGREINLEYFKKITKKLGSDFNDFIFESQAGREGEKLVRENIGPIFEESDGAVVYKGEQDGLHTRVFINKEGYPTYEAKDVGLLSLKFSRYNPDISIMITDHEQSEYFKVVVTAAGKINKIWQDKTIHRTHGRMSFKGQKMSSRLGGVPLAVDIIDTLLEEVDERTKDRTNIDVQANRDAIAIGALKFTILKSMAGKNINFDPETSLSFEGDSGPYLQYSAVRANSIFSKTQFSPVLDTEPANITEVEKYIDRFESVVGKCITLWEPHHMVNYLLELSQSFNSWYVQVKIIDEENKDMNYNLAIVKNFYHTMKNGLYLLGIDTPGRM